MQDTLALVVAHQPLMRLALSHYLRSHTPVSRCVETPGNAHALAFLESQRPALVLLAECGCSDDTPRLVRDMRRLMRDVRVLVVGAAADEELVRRVIRAGALGFVTVLDELSEVGLGVAAVMSGSLYVSRMATAGLLTGLSPHERRSASCAGEDALGQLSDRELEVFQRVGKGLSGKEIAAELCISVKTVDTHKLRIKEKLHLKRGAELVRVAANRMRG